MTERRGDRFLTSYYYDVLNLDNLDSFLDSPSSTFHDFHFQEKTRPGFRFTSVLQQLSMWEAWYDMCIDAQPSN